MAHPPLPQGKHASAVISTCQELTNIINDQTEVILDGESLRVSEIVGVACYQIPASITTDSRVHARLRGSVNLLDQKLANGETIYGVNTGFGGSADTRTDDHATLQQALIQHQASGVLLPTDRHGQQWAKGQTAHVHNSYGLTGLSMPSAMVRAAMLVAVVPTVSQSDAMSDSSCKLLAPNHTFLHLVLRALDRMSKVVPAYMIPSSFISVSNLPRTPLG